MIPTNQEIRELQGQIAKRDPNSPASRVGGLKHRLSNLFLPIDIDLQGWEESGFDLEYGREIVQAHRLDEIENLLHQARDLLYGNAGVYAIVKHTDCSEIWTSVEEFLPLEYVNASGVFGRAVDMMRLISIGNLRDLRQRLQKKNDLHDWLQELDKQLDHLIAKLR